jgi:hypothetical protein
LKSLHRKRRTWHCLARLDDLSKFNGFWDLSRRRSEAQAKKTARRSLAGIRI